MSILDDAHRLVHGERNDTYGHPLQDFERIAALWEPILLTPVTAEQVGLCMIALKLARETYGHTRDTLVDIAGYAETLQMIAEEKESRCHASGVDADLSSSADDSSVPPVIPSTAAVVKDAPETPPGTCGRCGCFLPHSSSRLPAHVCPPPVEA